MFGNRYFPPSYFADAYFGTTGEADPNAMRGVAAGVASVSGSLTGVTSGAFAVAANTGVLTLTGQAATLIGPKKASRGTVRKRRRGRAWNYERAFAAREAERLEAEPLPLPPKPAPKPQPFVSLLETYRPTITVTAKPTRPHWRIEDYQAALAEKRAAQEFERRQRELEDEELLLLLEAA